jgi:hypothetical protein
MIKRYLVCAAMLGIAAIPAMSHANARLTSVTSVSGGCVSGPTGPAVQAWDVEPGETYHITISGVTECANGGTDATLNVRVNSTGSGNWDGIATYVSPGVYEFDFTLPMDVTCTMPIFYCTTPGNASTGYVVMRNDGGMFQAHLRAATFQAGCTNPQEILGPDCQTVSTENTTWGAVKDHYRK